MEQEYIYVVSQKYKTGWNKLAKSQELFWFDEKQAIEWLKGQESWMQDACAVFKILVEIKEVEKIYDKRNLQNI